MSEKIEKQLPIGLGQTELSKDRTLLPAVEVANEVGWVNNKMNLPFQLKVGESSRLGMFLSPDPKEGENVHDLEVSSSHTRSGILGRVIFSDKEGRLYRDIDLKGIGINRDNEVQDVGDIISSSHFSGFIGTPGISNEELIRRDIKYSELFLKAGIRTHRVVALIELKEIIDRNGEKISIAEAKKRNILAEKDEPVIEVRAFGVRSRLWDVVVGFTRESYETNPQKSLKLLADAKGIVAQELGIENDKFAYSDYFEWLVKTIAKNIARMHYNGWVNGYLTAHNLTLDGRIVDLDSVELLSEHNKRIESEGAVSGKKIKSFERDLRQAITSLEKMLESVSIVQELHVDSIPLGWKFGDYFRKLYEDELKRLKDEKVPKVRK